MTQHLWAAVCCSDTYNCNDEQRGGGQGEALGRALCARRRQLVAFEGDVGMPAAGTPAAPAAWCVRARVRVSQSAVSFINARCTAALHSGRGQ